MGSRFCCDIVRSHILNRTTFDGRPLPQVPWYELYAERTDPNVLVVERSKRDVIGGGAEPRVIIGLAPKGR